MKAILLSATLFCTVLSASAQNAIDFDFANKKHTFKPLRSQLTKEVKYALNMPKGLMHHHGEAEIKAEIWNPFVSYLPIKASGHQVKYNFGFDIITNGLSGLNGQVPRWFRTEVQDANNLPKNVGGFVREFSGYFPCVLKIRNSKGETLDSIEIAGREEKFTVTMHRDFLFTSNTPAYPKPVYPFASEKDLADAEMLYRDALAKKAEQTLGYQVFSDRLWLTVHFLFNEYPTQKQTYGWGFVKAKNRKHDFSDLDGAVITYKAALDSMDKGSFSGCQRICKELKTTYSVILNSGEERIDKGVQQVLYYNLSHVSLLSGDAVAARTYYDLFLQSGAAVENSRIASELRTRIDLFGRYYALQKQLQQRDETLAAEGKTPVTYSIN